MNITAPQLALAWVLANGDDLIPIPGTKETLLGRTSPLSTLCFRRM